MERGPSKIPREPLNDPSLPSDLGEEIGRYGASDSGSFSAVAEELAARLEADAHMV